MGATFREIKADILTRITGGDWPPGSLIPGEVELSEQYGAARATVNRALRELAEEGLIERRRRSGTRVRPAPLRQARFELTVARHEVEASGAAYNFALLASENGPAPDWLRARIGLPEGSETRHLTCLHSADGAPWQHEERWINLSLLPQAGRADFSRQSPTEWLISQIPYSEVEISLSATSASPEVAAALRCAPGEPLLQIERATRWSGQPVTFVRLLHPRSHRLTTRY